jgi:hypothetical protein
MVYEVQQLNTVREDDVEITIQPLTFESSVLHQYYPSQYVISAKSQCQESAWQE